MASAGFLDEINTSFISGVDQLPEVTELRPDTTLQRSGVVSGWIDIIGFRNVAVLNNISYINESPEASVIVQGDSKFDYDNEKCNWKLNRFCVLYSFKKEIQISFNDTHTIAVLKTNTKYLYTYVKCGGLSCWYESQMISEDAVFQDTEIFPIRFNQSTSTATINVLQASDRNIITPVIDSNITSYKISTHNGSLIQHLQVGILNYTKKGVPYVKYMRLPITNISGFSIMPFGNSIITEDSNYSTLFYTPFGIVSNIKVNKKASEHSGIYRFAFYLLFVFVVLTYALRFMIKSVNL